MPITHLSQGGNKQMSYTYPFELIPLPYPYNGLEPFIDEKTMELHHDKHLATYVKNLNDTISKYPDLYSWPLEKLLYNISFLPFEIRQDVRHNAGGVYNHNMFFDMMTTKSTPIKKGGLLTAIIKNFGSYDNFKSEFKQAALKVFGSGYAWLVSDTMGNVNIMTTPNQDTPIANGLTPIILLDVWEHAYYLKHYNLRADYIDDWFNVIDFDKAQKRYEQAMQVDYGIL